MRISPLLTTGSPMPQFTSRSAVAEGPEPPPSDRAYIAWKGIEVTGGVMALAALPLACSYVGQVAGQPMIGGLVGVGLTSLMVGVLSEYHETEGFFGGMAAGALLGVANMALPQLHPMAPLALPLGAGAVAGLLIFEGRRARS